MGEIYQFSRQMMAVNSLDVLLKDIAHEAVNILQVSFCRLLLITKEGAWRCESVFPDTHRRDDKTRHPVPLQAQHIYQLCARKNSPTVLLRGNKLWAALENKTPYINRTSSLCLMPLAFSNDTLGMMVLGQYGSDGAAAFDEEKNNLITFIADQAAGAIYRAKVADRLHVTQTETVLALSKAIETRDDCTGSHSTRMTTLAERIAAACHCSDEEIRTIRWAGMLHDIGKIGIPDEVLRRPGPLDEAEWAIIRRHPDVGADIVLMVSNLAPVAELIRAHHERYDGNGYPRNLSGEEIPLGARILTVCDAYTAMTDERSYRLAISHEEALAELKRCAGTHFDPRVVEAFLSLYR